MDIELTIRDAQANDRDAMERICAHTWDDGDYIPRVWDRWLTDGEGPLIVGELDGQVVALSKITFTTPGEAWLHGMRVDPDHRRQGIARRFLEYSLSLGHDHGACFVRLGTAEDNTPVHHLAERAGMQLVGRYAAWQAEPLSEAATPAILCPDDLDTAQGFLAHSPVLAHCHGLYSAGWRWQALTAERLTELLRNGQIAALPVPGGGLAALALFQNEGEERGLWVGFADGHPGAVTGLATGLRALAGHRGAPRARVMVPDLPWLREAFRAAGYGPGDWDGELRLYGWRCPADPAADKSSGDDALPSGPKSPPMPGAETG